MDDLKQQMKDHFIKYASYVILDRAIPNVVDGLKPVQRRILEILWRQSDEKLHKVANIVGQTMQLHPHGDAPIYEALVNLANKGFALDRQGNFGNIYTGDPSAAARQVDGRVGEGARAADLARVHGGAHRTHRSGADLKHAGRHHRLHGQRGYGRAAINRCPAGPH